MSRTGGITPAATSGDPRAPLDRDALAARRQRVRQAGHRHEEPGHRARDGAEHRQHRSEQRGGRAAAPARRPRRRRCRARRAAGWWPAAWPTRRRTRSFRSEPPVAPKCRRASSVKHAVAATAERAPINCGPSSQPSGGESTEYAGVWWPPYHCPFQIVKPSRPNRSDAEDVRREVGRARLDDEVDQGERGRHQGRAHLQPSMRGRRATTGSPASAAGGGARRLGRTAPRGRRYGERGARHALRLACWHHGAAPTSSRAGPA